MKIAVDVPVAKEVAFTLVTNQKYKKKNKALSLLFRSLPNFKSKMLLILRTLSLFKAVTTCLATMTSKTIQAQIALSPILLASKPKSKAKLFA